MNGTVPGAAPTTLGMSGSRLGPHVLCSSRTHDDVERLVRDYADAEGPGVTDAVAHAIRTARRLERVERGEAMRRAAAERYLETAKRGWESEDDGWTRDELHDR